MEKMKFIVSLLTLFCNYAFCLQGQTQANTNLEGAPLPGAPSATVKAGAAPLPGLISETVTIQKTSNPVYCVPPELIGHRLIATIVFKSSLNSHTAYIGNPILATLKDDLIMNGRKIAPKGALVKGHISSVATARTLAEAAASSDRRYRSRGAVRIQFDQITAEGGVSIPISGLLSRQLVVIAAGTPQRREISVRDNGLIMRAEPSLSPEKRHAYNAARALTIAPVPASLLVNVAGPSLAMGAGALVDPAFAYNKPVDPSSSHKRLKAFTYAFVTNLPGAFYVQSVVEKGNEIELKEGDELALDICLKGDGAIAQPYTVTNIEGVVLPATDRAGSPPAINTASLPIDNFTPQLDGTSQKSEDIVSEQKIILPVNGGNRLLPIVQSSRQPSL